MKDSLKALEQAAATPAESKVAAHRTRWDLVLDTFIKFLNRRYEKDLHAFRKDGIVPGIVQLMVRPRGCHNYRITLGIFHFTRRGACIVDHNCYELKSTLALKEWLIYLVRTKLFRDIVTDLGELSKQPVIGVLHAGKLRDRRPSTDVLVTINADEQAKLETASEAARRKRITLHAHLPGSAPAGQGTYASGAALRWLVAGGYGLKLDRSGHALEGGNDVRLTGMPLDPVALE